MLEIEVKARISSIEEVEKTLLSRGAFLKREAIEEDIYFNHPCRDFEETDEALRLRKDGENLYITYKGPKVDRLTKTREEHSIKVDDLEDALAIVLALGFSEVKRIKKRRRYFTHNEYEIALDKVEGLGNFIEVERRGEYNPQEILQFLKSLGVEGSETRSYLELILKKEEGMED